MRVGIVYPTPYEGPGRQSFNATWARALKQATQADVLRVNLDPRSLMNDEIVESTRDAGFELLPIFDLDYDAQDPVAYASWAVAMQRRHRFRWIEPGNEPWTMHKTPARRYMEAVIQGIEALDNEADGPGLTVAWPCDAVRPRGQRDRRWEEWWRGVMRLMPTLRYAKHAVAIHPYRGELPPESSRSHWPAWAHKMPSLGLRLFGQSGRREGEHQLWMDLAGQMPLLVTEVGWRRQDVDDETNARYLRAELTFYQALGVELVCVYAYGGDEWGVMNADLSPRPQADAIRMFVEAQRGS